MTHHPARAIVAGLAVFVLVLGAALVLARGTTPPPRGADPPAATDPAPAAPSDGAVLVLPQDLAARDAGYQQALAAANAQLAEANRRLTQANAQLAAAYAQLTPSPVPPTAPSAATPRPPTATAVPAPEYAVSVAQAAQIALNAAPGAALTARPTLVRFQGSVAYEVALDRGNVYVDANSGQVLYNGAQAVVPAAAPSTAAGTSRSREPERENDDD